MEKTVELEKINNPTRCLMKYCKQKNSLIKKCNEISISCDVDVALVAFSPTGRVSSFCSREKIEDVIQRYLDLPPKQRYVHLQNADKLEQLDHQIKGDENKIHYLKNQIQHLELELQESTVKRDIQDNKLKFYEPAPDKEPTLSQLTWFERNLRASLEQVKQKKHQLILISPSPSMKNYNYNYQGFGMNKTWKNPSSTQRQPQCQPCVNQYSTKARDPGVQSQDLRHQANRILAAASTYFVRNPPATTTFPSGDCPGSSSSLIQGTQFLHANYSPFQNQPVITDKRTFIDPVEQLGSSSVGNMEHGEPIWFQTQTSGYDWNNLSSQNIVAPTSQFHSYTYSIDDPNPNVNHVTLPSNSYPGILSSGGNTEPAMADTFTIAPNDDDFEPVLPSQLINNITAAAAAISAPTSTVTTDNFEICRNNSSNSDLGPNNQAGGGANKEDDPLDLDDFSWEEGLDLEELLSSLD